MTCIESPAWFKVYLPEHNVQRLVQIVFDASFSVVYRASSVALLARPDRSASPGRWPLYLSLPALRYHSMVRLKPSARLVFGAQPSMRRVSSAPAARVGSLRRSGIATQTRGGVAAIRSPICFT